jgi:hypothetical protein
VLLSTISALLLPFQNYVKVHFMWQDAASNLVPSLKSFSNLNIDESFCFAFGRD